MTYRTSNINFAAFLMSEEFDLEDIVKNGKKVIFVFEIEEDELEDEKNQFFSGRGLVGALSYSKTLKSLKESCFKVLNKR